LISFIKIFSITFLLFFLISCNTKEDKSPLTEDEIIKIELNKGIKKDTVFLGYVLGMDENKANRYKAKLYENGTIFTATTFDSYGHMELKDGSLLSFGKYDRVFVQHDLDFYNGKLYKITAYIETTTFQNKLAALIKFYESKYGTPSILEPYYDEKNLNIATWIQGNRKVQIKPMPLLNKIYIYYEDTYLSSIMNEEKKKEDDSIKQQIRQKSGKDIWYIGTV